MNQTWLAKALHSFIKGLGCEGFSLEMQGSKAPRQKKAGEGSMAIKGSESAFLPSNMQRKVSCFRLYCKSRSGLLFPTPPLLKDHVYRNYHVALNFCGF